METKLKKKSLNNSMEYALVGGGGHAREVMAQMQKRLPCFVDDEYVDEFTLPISSLDTERYMVMVAVSNSVDRFNLVNKLDKNTKFFTFIHPTALILDNDIEIGIGSFIGAYSILTTNIKIGKHSILNRINQIGHDSVIGDFFSAMPGSIVSGNCKISDFVYLGSNSCVKEKTTITNNITIGLSSSVVKDLNESGTYVGCPVKKITS